MHLTNYAVNKKSSEYIKNESHTKNYVPSRILLEMGRIGKYLFNVSIDNLLKCSWQCNIFEGGFPRDIWLQLRWNNGDKVGILWWIGAVYDRMRREWCSDYTMVQGNRRKHSV